MLGAMAGHQLDGWSDAASTDPAFLGTSMSLLAAMSFRCTAVLETKGEGKKWLPNWSTHGQNI